MTKWYTVCEALDHIFDPDTGEEEIVIVKLGRKLVCDKKHNMFYLSICYSQNNQYIMLFLLKNELYELRSMRPTGHK